MVDMKLSNNKLVDRGVKMLTEALQIPSKEALRLLTTYGSVRNALEHYKK
jgi:N-acetylmuramic acid 6-phosphate etherase